MDNPQLSGEALAALSLSMIAIGELVIKGITSREVMREKVDSAMLAFERGGLDASAFARAHQILSGFLADQLS